MAIENEVDYFNGYLLTASSIHSFLHSSSQFLFRSPSIHSFASEWADLNPALGRALTTASNSEGNSLFPGAGLANLCYSMSFPKSSWLQTACDQIWAEM